MKKIQIILLIIFIIASLSVAVFGVKEEARGDIFNGAPYYLFVVPFLSLAGGLIINFLRRNKSFISNCLLSCASSTITFLLLAFLGMIHYKNDWQPEWIWFWLAMSAVLFILQGIVHLVGKLKKDR